MNEPEPDAALARPAWQTPVLVPLLDTNNAGGKAIGAPTESTSGFFGPS